MTQVITLAPIAAQVARSVSLDQLFPRSALADALRDHREKAPESGEAKLPDDVEPFFGHYCVVTRAAVQLLGAPAFDRLARFHDEVEDEYMPGGPPMSPVYDSFAMQFVLGAVPQGIGNETSYSVLARLLLRDSSRARLQCMAQSLTDARFELYRVKGATGRDPPRPPRLVLRCGVSCAPAGATMAHDFCVKDNQLTLHEPGTGSVTLSRS